MLKFMGSITLLASGSMSSAGESQMAPFPAVVTLGNAQVYVCGPDGGDESAKVKEVINQ